MNDKSDNIYREEILEHYHNPDNSGEIKNPDIQIKDNNPLCGDAVEIFAEIEKKDGKKILKDVKFRGSGCVISMASADIILEHVKGKNIDEIMKIERDDVLKLLGIEVSASRVKCAMLAINALKKGIVEYAAR